MADTIIQGTTTRTPQHDFVYRMYAAGYNFIPLSGKHPPCVPWLPWQAERVPKALLYKWSTEPFMSKAGQPWRPEILNWGLLTGKKPYSPAPGLIVVDSDDEDADRLWLSVAPETPVQQITGRAGGKGRQRGYRRPAEIESIPNRQKTWYKGREYNLDLRGDGGYIVAPGSLHPKSRQRYREIEPWTPQLIAHAPVYDPAWLICEGQPKLKFPISQPDHFDDPAQLEPLGDFDYEQAIANIPIPMAERIAQAQQYLAGVPGTQVGHGADRACSGLVLRILHGFALPEADAVDVLTEWGQRDDQLDEYGAWYPWKAEQLLRKVRWARTRKYGGILGDKLHLASLWTEPAHTFEIAEINKDLLRELYGNVFDE